MFLLALWLEVKVSRLRLAGEGLGAGVVPLMTPFDARMVSSWPDVVPVTQADLGEGGSSPTDDAVRSFRLEELPKDSQLSVRLEYDELPRTERKHNTDS